jgi:hypothetical protein
MLTPEEPMEPLPIRRRLTVLRDGSTRTADLVFCESSGRSVPLSRCVACRFAGRVVRDAAGRSVAVECCRFTLRSASTGAEPPPSGDRAQGAGVAQVAAALPLGLSLFRPAFCVMYDAPLTIAMRALAMESSAYGVAIVDEQQRLVGMLPRAKAALALIRAAGEVAVEHMVAEWGSIDESQSLSAAFATMTGQHARELTVVGEGRMFVGLVRDIDALRFVAYVSRTGLRPRFEHAA